MGLIVFYSSKGCGDCKKILEVVKGMDAKLVDVSEASEEEIAKHAEKYGMISAPLIAYNGKILFHGKTPTREELERKINEGK